MDQRQAQLAALRRGVQQHRAGELGDARRSYLEFLRDVPDSAQALHLLGKVERQAGNLNAAETSLRKATAASGAQAVHCQSLGDLLRQKGELTEALSWYTRAVELDPDYGPAWAARGRLHRQLGRSTAAISDLYQAVALMPTSANAQSELGLLYEGQGDLARAATAFERAIIADPANASAHNNLGAMHLAAGRVDQAERCFEAAVAADPALAGAHDNLGRARRERGAYAEAIDAHGQALALAPGRAASLAARGWAHCGLRDLASAESDFSAALAVDRACAEAVAGLARLAEYGGDYQAGLDLVETAANAPGAHPDVVLACARLLRQVYRVPEAIDLVRPWVEAGEVIGSARLREAHFVLGQLLDDDGCESEAFAQFRAGNRRGAHRFDAAAWHRHVAELQTAFSLANMSVLPRANDIAGELVFVVGMPRAGCSLVAQVLAGHSQIRVAGPRRTIGDFAASLAGRTSTLDPYPHCVAALDATQLERMSAEYRASYLPLDDGVDVVVDSMPLNFAHLGLIHLVFPHARIVHCQRDALDTCLSCYFDDSASPHLAFATGLEDAAAYYGDYRKLMAHWSQLPDLELLHIDYEALVTSPSEVTQQLLDFLSLPFEERCVNFYEPSAHPVMGLPPRENRAISTAPVGRARRYQDFVGDLRRRLDTD